LYRLLYREQSLGSSSLFPVLGEARNQAVTLNDGLFVTSTVSFLIVALVLFFFCEASAACDNPKRPRPRGNAPSL